MFNCLDDERSTMAETRSHVALAIALVGASAALAYPITASPATEPVAFSQLEEKQVFAYQQAGDEVSFYELNFSESEQIRDQQYRIRGENGASYSVFFSEVGDPFLGSVIETNATAASSHGFAIVTDDFDPENLESEIIGMQAISSLSSLGVEIRSGNTSENLHLGYTWTDEEVPEWEKLGNQTIVSTPVTLEDEFDRVSVSTAPLPLSIDTQSSCPETVDHGTVYAYSGDYEYVEIYADLYTNRQSTYPCFSTSSFYASTNPTDRWIEGRGGSGTGDISWADMRLFNEDKSEVIDVSSVDCSQYSGAGNLYCQDKSTWSSTKIEDGFADGDTYTRWGGLTG